MIDLRVLQLGRLDTGKEKEKGQAQESLQHCHSKGGEGK